MAWGKLSMRKEFGGMGFKNLYAFDLAMLMKQGWKLLTNPKALVSHIFKVRYSPKRGFLGGFIRSQPIL